MSKIFIAFGHPKYNTGESFNAALRDEFITAAKKRNFEIDLINIYEEKQIKFWDGSPPDQQILDYRKRIELADIFLLMSPCHNYIHTSATENFLAHTVAPPWAFSYRKILLNYGWPIPNKMKGKKVIISTTYGGPSFLYSFVFQQIPRRIKKFLFNYLCGCRVQYMRFYEVLPNMPKEVFEKHMATVRKTVSKL